MAAAHLNLPHLQFEHFMVSSAVASYGEGWPHIESMTDVCVPPVDGIFYADQPLPTLVHYCQIYAVGGIGFSKRQVPTNIFSCKAPLFMDPPLHFDTMVNNKHIDPNDWVRHSSSLTCHDILYFKSFICIGRAIRIDVWWLHSFDICFIDSNYISKQ